MELIKTNFYWTIRQIGDGTTFCEDLIEEDWRISQALIEKWIWNKNFTQNIEMLIILICKSIHKLLKL